MNGVRRWWRAVALTLVASVACVLLGFWQIDRREQRLARIAEVEANYDAEPVALGSVLPDTGSPLPQGAEYTPVSVTGTYDPSATVLVRNRPLDGRYGYLVLVPLELAGPPDASGSPDRVLVVDRGWIPSGPDGSAPASVPVPPTGTVRVVARLRPPEPPDTRSAPQGQVQHIDLAGSVTASLGGAAAQGLVTGAYAQLAVEEPAPAQRPALAPEPPADEGPHLGYSIQWFVFAAGMWAFLVVHVRRVAADEAAATSHGEDAGRALSTGTARVTGARTRRPPRPRRDEDAEDALLDAAEAAAGTPAQQLTRRAP